MRRVRILVLAVILIAIVCAGVSLYAYQHNKRAEENTIDIIKLCCYVETLFHAERSKRKES